MDWENEPDLAELRRLYSLLASDFDQAIVSLEQLAGRGSRMSMIYLGTAYYGKRTSECRDQAKYWFGKADDSGSALGAYMMGRIFEEEGRVGEAVTAYIRASRRDHLPSMYQLGLMYKDGLGVPKDHNKCREWWETASSKGHIYAMRDLGTLYLKGTFGTRLRIQGARLVLLALWNTVRLLPDAVKRAPIPEDRLSR